MSIQEACRLSSKPHDKTAQTKDELVFFFALAESHGIAKKAGLKKLEKSWY